MGFIYEESVIGFKEEDEIVFFCYICILGSWLYLWSLMDSYLKLILVGIVFVNILMDF